MNVFCKTTGMKLSTRCADTRRWSKYTSEGILVLLVLAVRAVFVLFCFFITFTFQLNSYIAYRRFYPQRSSGQAVVTGVVPSPPRYVPSFLSRIRFSIPTARTTGRNTAVSVLALPAVQNPEILESTAYAQPSVPNPEILLRVRIYPHSTASTYRTRNLMILQVLAVPTVRKT